MQIKKAFKYLITILIFAGIYIILREKISLPIVLGGCAVAAAALWLTDRFLIRDHYVHQFTLKPFRFIGYFLFLLYKILKNGITYRVSDMVWQGGLCLFFFLVRTIG